MSFVYVCVCARACVCGGVVVFPHLSKAFFVLNPILVNMGAESAIFLHGITNL